MITIHHNPGHQPWALAVQQMLLERGWLCRLNANDLADGIVIHSHDRTARRAGWEAFRLATSNIQGYDEGRATTRRMNYFYQ